MVKVLQSFLDNDANSRLVEVEWDTGLRINYASSVNLLEKTSEVVSISRLICIIFLQYRTFLCRGMCLYSLTSNLETPCMVKTRDIHILYMDKMINNFPIIYNKS